mgnify:CR=1 FL=1
MKIHLESSKKLEHTNNVVLKRELVWLYFQVLSAPFIITTNLKFVLIEIPVVAIFIVVPLMKPTLAKALITASVGSVTQMKHLQQLQGRNRAEGLADEPMEALIEEAERDSKEKVKDNPKHVNPDIDSTWMSILGLLIRRGHFGSILLVFAWGFIAFTYRACMELEDILFHLFPIKHMPKFVWILGAEWFQSCIEIVYYDTFPNWILSI